MVCLQFRLYREHKSSLNIFFRDDRVPTLKRHEQYNYTDFMAICGGLLGLFLGISVLSVVEFVYYFTLCLYWRLLKWKRDNAVMPFKSKVDAWLSNTKSMDLR